MATGRDIAPSSERDRKSRSRPVDLVFLARCTMGDRALECEILQHFAQQASGLMVELRAATDTAGRRTVLERIGLLADSVGAQAIAELAGAAGQVVVVRRDDESAELIADLGHAVEEANAYIDNLLAA